MESLKDPLEQTFEKTTNSSKEFPLELFYDKDYLNDGIAFKTDLTHTEHVLVSCQTAVNKILTSTFLKFNTNIDLYGDFLTEFKRHKVSLDRKSRQEFVSSISTGIKDNDIQRMSNIKNLTESRI